VSALSSFAKFFQEGGPFMYPILAVGVVILATFFERFFVISRASSWNSKKLTHDLAERIRKGDRAGAIALADKIKSPLGRVASAIAHSSARTEESVFAAADNEATVVVPPLSRRLSNLNLLANIATLLGLLGTVFGLITAFAAVGAADPSQRSSFLAVGIAQALNTTGFGLIIAVPALLMHGFLVGRVERILQQIDEMTVHLTRTLFEGGTHASASRAGSSAPAQTASSGIHHAPRHPSTHDAPRGH
jgi:biopolymer transport protein ExbB/TolQ